MKLLTVSLAACAVLAPLTFAADLIAEAPKKAAVESSKNFTFDGQVRFRAESFDGWNQKAYGDAASKTGDPDDTVLMRRRYL